MVTTLVRLGFDDPESLAVELEALGAWPPRPGANGHRLLEELAASANPTLATRALAAIAQATSDPGAFAAGLRRRPALRRRLIAVVAASRSLGRWLAAHPDEVERLGDGRALAAPRPRAELVRQARAAVPASAGVEAGWRWTASGPSWPTSPTPACKPAWSWPPARRRRPATRRSAWPCSPWASWARSEEHTSELQSHHD